VGNAIEAPDPGALAAFYSELLGWPVAHQEPGTAIVKPPQDSVFMVFQLAEDYCRRSGPRHRASSAR
jgi:hypothetical protein